MSKIKMLKAATEVSCKIMRRYIILMTSSKAAISILRIDDMIKIAPPPPQDDGHGH